MTKDTGTPPREDKTPRRARGFARAGTLVTQQVRTAAAKHGFAETRLLTHWAEIAGPEIAAIARPVKMTRPRGGGSGTLVVLIRGAHAPQMQMMLPTLRARVNAACGMNAVGRIQITQTSALGLAEDAPAERAEPPKPEAPPERLAPVIADLSSIGDDGLRTALETLAKNVLSRSAGNSRTRSE